MIGYLEGSIIGHEADGIVLLAGHVGYEILLDPITLAQITAEGGDRGSVSLYIYYHVTERQPKPTLIGFVAPGDKAFFQLFITVSAIGPMKAVKALTKPVGEVARAIEDKDVAFLSQLSGIGKRTAEKIIATLNGKVEHFVSYQERALSESPTPAKELTGDIAVQVADVLVDQLGHSTASARRMIKEAFDRNPSIATPEDLFDEIYQEDR